MELEIIESFKITCWICSSLPTQVFKERLRTYCQLIHWTLFPAYVYCSLEGIFFWFFTVFACMFVLCSCLTITYLYADTLYGIPHQYHAGNAFFLREMQCMHDVYVLFCFGAIMLASFNLPEGCISMPAPPPSPLCFFSV